MVLFDDISCAATHSTQAFLCLCELLLSLRENILAEQDGKERTKLQGHAVLTLICLRLLYSLPKNVRLFKMVFPTSLFSKFVDIETPKSQAAKVSAIVMDLLGFKSTDLQNFRANLERTEFEIHEAKDPVEGAKSVAGYVFKEQIGQGAFGKVYKAQKIKLSSKVLQDGELMSDTFAVKEIANRQDNSDKISREVRTLASVSVV